MPKLITSSSRDAVRRTNEAIDMKQSNQDGNNLLYNESLSCAIPSTTSAANLPYLNKIVIIIGGSNVGLKGKVTNIANRGWWTIDNPKLAGKKVTGKLCRLVSSMSVSRVQQYEALVGSIQGGNHYGRVNLGDGNRSTDPSQVMSRFNIRRGLARQKRSKRAKSFESSQSLAKKYRLRGNCTPSRRRPDNFTFPFLSTDESSVIKKKLLKSVVPGAKNIESEMLFPSEKANFHHRQPNHVSLLPPLLLNSSDNLKCFETTESLRHLQPDLVIDIFNRKTGRIMRGENGVKVRELAPVLRSHAEYEPIVPLPLVEPCSDEIRRQHVWRMARSSNNTRVSVVVQPQVRAHNSMLKGSDVMVMGGPSRGMIGKVVTCLSGNWCMISDLLDTDDRNPNIVVHASKLNVIPMKSGIEKNHRLGNSSQRSRFAVKNTMHKSNNEMINITHWKKN